MRPHPCLTRETRDDDSCTAQILFSKLYHRGLGAPVRDLYDMSVAFELAQAELAIAVNGRSDSEPIRPARAR